MALGHRTICSIPLRWSELNQTIVGPMYIKQKLRLRKRFIGIRGEKISNAQP